MLLNWFVPWAPSELPLEIIEAPGPQILQTETISVVSPAGIYHYHTRLMKRTPWVCLSQVKFSCVVEKMDMKIFCKIFCSLESWFDDDLIFLEIFYPTLFYFHGYRFLLWCTVKKILSVKLLFAALTWPDCSPYRLVCHPSCRLAQEESQQEATLAACFPWGGTWCVCLLLCVLLPTRQRPSAPLSCTNWSSECSSPHKYLSPQIFSQELCFESFLSRQEHTVEVALETSTEEPLILILMS